MHYLGGVGPHPGPEGQSGRLLSRLTHGELQSASPANPYDIVQLPGFESGIEYPEAAFMSGLLAAAHAEPALFAQLRA